VRNWTYVGDTVRGLILAAERIEDGSAINLGTEERIRVADAAREIIRYTDHRAEIRFMPEMPTGPRNRVASNARARDLLGWQPDVRFKDGLRRTIDWYFAAKQRTEVARVFSRMLTER
jgi:nucleoside-diphosphate-sugar epimerase